MIATIRYALFALFVLTASGAALAAPLQVGAAPAKNGFLPVAAEIGQQLQELVTGDPAAEIEPQETFGTRALGVILSSFKILATEGGAFFNNFAALPQLSHWLDQQMGDAALADRWGQIGRLLLLVVGGAFAAGWLMDLILLPLRRRIYRRTFPTILARFGGLVAWFFLSLIPVLIFVGAALAIIDHSEPAKLVRFIVMAFVYALALLRLVRVGLRFFLAPYAPSLRLMPISSGQAVYVQNWLSWYSGIALIGYFLIDIAHLLKVPEAALSGFRSLLALAIVGMTVAVILQKRSFVSSFLRGDLSAARARQSLADNLRLWFARTWHVLAIAYLVIGYFVTMLGAEGGFLALQQGTLGTLIVLLLMRFAFYMSSKLTYKKKDEEATSGIYRPVLRFFARVATWALGVLGILAAWGADVGALLASPWGQRILGSAFTITSTLLVLVFAYELIHASIERKLNKRDGQGKVVEASARSKTLLPMIRYIAIFILCLTGGFVVLSELGIDTGPLLAGAGVLGVAVGFGSQTLVKDFLTGLFIIFEDTISVGDVVKIGDNSGVVEGLTIRTVRLRDLQGDLHILPFSEISRIVNSSKGFAFALMDIGVAYDSDLDHVMNVMREVGDGMKKDPVLGSSIIDKTEILGVENFGDSAITVRCRIKTFGGKQWEVRRAFLLRLKKRFDEEKIEIPFPHIVHISAGGGQAAKEEDAAE